ncbi:hypothetical protein [Paenibacillus sonchi]|uniref:hypothetical protein n=1 Tax=Paenibacillus sonchi TaxID=373687 RepID=UPI001F417513|nr:hypothetical protein [Paenibacillus sonchi]
MYLLEAVELSKVYGREGRWFTPDIQKVAAVNHLSLRLKPHENLGLVGEAAVVKARWPVYCLDWNGRPPEGFSTRVQISQIGA